MYAEETVIYSDILFLINFSLDYLCLFITSRLIGTAPHPKRLLLGAAIGGAYSFLPYLVNLPPYIFLPLHLLAATLICISAFGVRNRKRIGLSLICFIASSALMGGLVTAAYSLIGGYFSGIYKEVSAVSLCLICMLSALIALAYGLICRKKLSSRSAEVLLYLNDLKIRASLLCDSGNLVTEPFSALPVIILSSSVLPSPYNEPESLEFPLNIRAIPFSTGAGEGCFFGFRPEKAEILRLGKKPKSIDAYIAIDTNRKSYSGYDGIIPICLI